MAWKEGYCALLLAGSAADIPAIKANYETRMKSVKLGIPGIGGSDPLIYSLWKRVDSRLETFFELRTRGLDSGSLEFYWSRPFISSYLIVGSNPGPPVSVTSFGEKTRPKRSMAIIITAMIYFMLLPTVNLVNINISRITERMSEIGVRKSFGASSWTLTGQFLIENLILTLAGGALGFLFTRLVLYYITLSGLFLYTEFYLNYRIFLYAMLLALFFGLMSGVYPAWKMSRLHPVAALRTSIAGGFK